MNNRHPLALVAGTATMLAALPLSSVFASLSWMIYCGLAIVVTIGTAMLVRSARGPVWVQTLAMMAALLVYLTVCFPSGQEFLRLIPTGHTFTHFNDLLVLAGQQMRQEAVPVPDLDGLLLLTTAGVGLMAVLVDIAAVGLRRPALAGLPMLALYSIPVAVLPSGVSVIPFLFAAVGYLWLLVTDSVDRVRRFGRRFTGEGRDVDVWEPSPLAAAGRRLGLVGLVIAIILPLAIPGLSTGLLDALRNNGTSGLGTGNGDGSINGGVVDMNAYLTNQLLVRDKVTTMVKLTTTDPSPYYLRFGVADVIQNGGFVTQPPTGQSLDKIPAVGRVDVPGVTSQDYKATIDIQPGFAMPRIPVFQQVTRTQGLDASWFYDTNTSEIFAQSAVSGGTHYTADFTRTLYTPDALRLADPLTPNEHQLATVPPVERVTDLVGTLIAGKTTEYDKIRALYDYFTSPANNFTYSVVAPDSKSGNPIVDFLDARRGFCVQYAAAMAWLSRVAGYPARVAFGFTRGAGANGAGVYMLTNFNLHAWTEVFFPGFGWIPFDTTPAGAVAGSVQSIWAPDPNKQGQTDTLPTPAPDTSGGPDDLQNAHGSDSTTGDGGQTTTGLTKLANPWVLGGIALLVLIVALALTPALRRRALTRRRKARSGDVIVIGGSVESVAGDEVFDPAAADAARRDAHAAWAELRDTMVDFRVPVDDAETPRATGDRLGALLVRDDDADRARTLARAEERARYARMPLRADGLDHAVTAVRSALSARATRRERLSAAILPRSVIERWRQALIGRAAALVTTAGRVRAAFGVVSPRRALSRATR